MGSTESKPWKAWLLKLLNIRLRTTKRGAKPVPPLGHNASEAHTIKSLPPWGGGEATLVLRTQRLYPPVYPFKNCSTIKCSALSGGWRELKDRWRVPMLSRQTLWKHDGCVNDT